MYSRYRYTCLLASFKRINILPPACDPHAASPHSPAHPSLSPEPPTFLKVASDSYFYTRPYPHLSYPQIPRDLPTPAGTPARIYFLSVVNASRCVASPGRRLPREDTKRERGPVDLSRVSSTVRTSVSRLLYIARSPS